MSLLLLAMVVMIAYALAGLSVVVLGLEGLLGESAFAWALAGTIVFVFAYTMIGGTYAHAYTNTLQGILMAVAAVVLLVAGVATFFLALAQHSGKELSIAIFAQEGIYALFAATCLPVLFGMFQGWLPSRGAIVLSSLAALAVHFGFGQGKLTLLTEADWTNPGLTVTYGLAAALAVIGGDWVLSRLTSGRAASASRARSAPAAPPGGPVG